MDEHYADAQLRQSISSGFIPQSSWSRLSTLLAAYSLPMMEAWISSGKITEKVRRVTGIRTPRLPRPLREKTAASELAGLTVAMALRSFRTDLEENRGWAASRGSPIAPFFTGKCLIKFPNEYRKLLRELRYETELPINSADPRLIARLPMMDDPESIVINGLEIIAMLNNATGGRQNTADTPGSGHGFGELADTIGISLKGIEVLIHGFLDHPGLPPTA